MAYIRVRHAPRSRLTPVELPQVSERYDTKLWMRDLKEGDRQFDRQRVGRGGEVAADPPKSGGHADDRGYAEGHGSARWGVFKRRFNQGSSVVRFSQGGHWP